MAGSLSVTTADRGRGVTEYLLDWTSDASGNVSAIAQAVRAGVIVGCKFVPDSGGTQPTDLYDLVLNDADSVDLLTGRGANLSQSTSTRAVPLLNSTAPVWFEGGNLTLVVSNAGNAKGGLVYVWVAARAP